MFGIKKLKIDYTFVLLKLCNWYGKYYFDSSEIYLVCIEMQKHSL